MMGCHLMIIIHYTHYVYAYVYVYVYVHDFQQPLCHSGLEEAIFHEFHSCKEVNSFQQPENKFGNRFSFS